MRYITMRRRDIEQIVRTTSINSNEVIVMWGLKLSRLTYRLPGGHIG